MKLLAYTSPARGHLNPMMGPLLELARRGAEIHVRTLASEVEAVRDAGLECEPIDPAIEAIVMDDHAQKGQIAKGKRSMAVWGERAPTEVVTFAVRSPPSFPTLPSSTLPHSARRPSPRPRGWRGRNRGHSCSRTRRRAFPPSG